jgi:hypothetical protein
LVIARRLFINSDADWNYPAVAWRLNPVWLACVHGAGGFKVNVLWSFFRNFYKVWHGRWINNV